MAVIHVDEEGLNNLKNALLGAGQDYKERLARLTNLVNEITSGDIQGEPAIDLLNKFEEKRDTFNKLTEEIERAEDYMGLKTNKFGNMLGDLKAGMK